MGTGEFSRRQFAQTIAAATAAALVAPRLAAATAAAGMLPDGLPESTIQLNANENPYGPCPAALAATTGSGFMTMPGPPP